MVLFHFFSETFGYISPSLRSPWTGFIFDGKLAVYVFFVLSGDALSVGYLASRRKDVIDRLAAKRYFRLTIPIVIACTIAYLLLCAGLVFNQEAAVIVKRPDWLGQFVDFEPSIVQMLRYALWNVYGSHTAQSSYNPFMWTMSIELVGSLAVFVFLYVSSALKSPGRVAAVIALFLYLLTSWYAMFFVGMVLGFLRVSGHLARLRASRRVQFSSALLLSAAVLAISLEQDRLGVIGNQRFYFDAGAASLLVSAFYVNTISLRAFRAPVSQWLGTISFPLYLVHFCVLISLTSYLIVQADTLTARTIVFVASTSVVTSLAAAVVFHFAEKRLLALMDKMVKTFLLSPRRTP